MPTASKASWQKVTALVTLSAGGVVTGFSFAPKATAADLTSPSNPHVRLMALKQAAHPAATPASDSMLRSAIVNVAQYFLRLSAGKTPAEMEELIWQHDSVDGVDHGESCAAFASLTLELAAQVVGEQSWVTGGTSYPWPLHKWADVRVDANPSSIGVVSVLQDARAHGRWHPLGDGYVPEPGDWVLFDGHVEVVTRYAGGILHTIGGDSLPNFSVNAHEYDAPLANSDVAGFVDNGHLPHASAAVGTTSATGASGGSSAAATTAAAGSTGSGSLSARGRSAATASSASTNDVGAAEIPGFPASGSTASAGTVTGLPGTSSAASRPAHPNSAQSGSAASSRSPSTGAGPSAAAEAAPGPGRASAPGATASATRASADGTGETRANASGATVPGSRASGTSGTGAGASGAGATGTNGTSASASGAAADSGAADIPATWAPTAGAARHSVRGLGSRIAATRQRVGARAHGTASAIGDAAIPGIAATAHRTGTGTATATRPRPGTTTQTAPYQVHHPPASVTHLPDSRSQRAFIAAVAPGAITAQQKYGVPAAVTIAQAIDESGWGRSELAVKDHNLFGIKGSGPAGSDMLPTEEYLNGQWVTETAAFRVYRDVAQSIDDHGQLLATSGYYTKSMSYQHDPDAFAAALTGIYATDPDYGAYLINLMSRYHLYRYDAAQPATATAPASPARTAKPGRTGQAAIPGEPAMPVTPGGTNTAPGTARHGAPASRRPTAGGTSRTAPGTGHGGVTPGGTAPSRTTPGRTAPGQTTPGRTGPGQTTPGRTGPGGTGPARPAPGSAQPGGTSAGTSPDAPALAAGPPSRSAGTRTSSARASQGGSLSNAALIGMAPGEPTWGGTVSGRPGSNGPGSSGSAPGGSAHSAPRRASRAARAQRVTQIDRQTQVTSARLMAATTSTAPATSTPATSARTTHRRAADQRATGRPTAARVARPTRYQHQIPLSVRSAFVESAKVPLLRSEPLYQDVASMVGIPWQLLAACDWMQCEAQPRYSPVRGEKLGAANPDGTCYRTKSAALEQCACDLVELADAVYGIDLTAPEDLSVRELANAFAAFRWGGLLRRHRTSALEFPYSVAGLTSQHMHMRWPNIDETEAPDKPGGRFRRSFGAVPVVLGLHYPATV